MSYKTDLKNPKWQKKRLQILEIFKFRCSNCEDSTSELHVHHRYYKKGKKPWEYELGDYVVFCSTCHDNWHLRTASP